VEPDWPDEPPLPDDAELLLAALLLVALLLVELLPQPLTTADASATATPDATHRFMILYSTSPPHVVVIVGQTSSQVRPNLLPPEGDP
jgi:hypothetical protein